MHWIIQDNMFHEKGIEELIDLLPRLGLPMSLHKVVPFIGELQPDISPEGEVICIGSYSLRHVAKTKGWDPGVFDLFKYDFLVQKQWWKNELLNHDSVVCRFKDADPKVEEFFIRPIADSKYFAGTVMDHHELCYRQQCVVDLGEDDGTGLRGETLVMYSEPKSILSEYRMWIVDGKVVTSSLYKRGGRVVYQECIDKRAINYAEKMAAIWQPVQAFVMDVAHVDYSTYKCYKIIEINTLNSCGLYAANVGKLVEGLENRKRGLWAGIQGPMS